MRQNSGLHTDVFCMAAAREHLIHFTQSEYGSSNNCFLSISSQFTVIIANYSTLNSTYFSLKEKRPFSSDHTPKFKTTTLEHKSASSQNFAKLRLRFSQVGTIPWPNFHPARSDWVPVESKRKREILPISFYKLTLNHPSKIWDFMRFNGDVSNEILWFWTVFFWSTPKNISKVPWNSWCFSQPVWDFWNSFLCSLNWHNKCMQVWTKFI